MVYGGLRGWGRGLGRRGFVGVVEEEGAAVGELDILLVELIA